MAQLRENRDKSPKHVKAGTAVKAASLPMLFRQKELGTSLLEVMASILIFSIGMLGYAAVQTRSLKESYDLQQRTIVLWQSQALIDRIRANRTAIDTYIGKVGHSNCNSPDARPKKLCSDMGQGGEIESCSSREVAEFDSWDIVCNQYGTTIDEETVHDTPIELSVSLSCSDGSVPCPPRKGLILTYNWASKAALDDPQITHSGVESDSQQIPGPEQQNYRIEFMP